MDETEYLKCPCKECGTNIEYPPDAAGTTVSCPNCGQWTELAAPEKEPAVAPGVTINFVWVVVGILVLLVAGGAVFMVYRGQMAGREIDAKITQAAKPTNSSLAVATNAPSNVVTQAAPTPPPPPKPKSHDDLKMGGIKLEKTPNSTLVNAIGTVTNDSTYERFGVRVELDLFDAQQKKVGTAQDYKEIMEPHQAWEFHALVPEKKAVKAELGAITEQD